VGDFTYKLPIGEKITIIRNAGFKVVPREEAQAVFHVPDDMPGAYVVFSHGWFFADGPDYGMVEAGDDPVILEASFAEAYSDDSWGDIDPATADKIIEKLESAARRANLKVVK
jgi:hypothetical protein